MVYNSYKLKYEFSHDAIGSGNVLVALRPIERRAPSASIPNGRREDRGLRPVRPAAVSDGRRPRPHRGGATTCTKRIILKLGINRQAGLVLLYMLTVPPFRRGGGEPTAFPKGPAARQEMQAMSNRTMPHPRTVIAAALAMLGGAAGAVAAGAPVLQLPLACDIGRNCFIQTYVDADPSPLARDYMCGARAQDGHNGTDFRLPSMAAQRDGVDVLAAADGRVLRQRDGMADVPVAGSDHSAVQNTECGNGLVIDHGGVGETQYCHLAKGSLRLKPGEMVKAGQPVGRVGLSGLSQYPHVHFTVRHGGRIIDPFAHDASPGSCGAGASLWGAGTAAGPRLSTARDHQPRICLGPGDDADGRGSPHRAGPGRRRCRRARGLYPRDRASGRRHPASDRQGPIGACHRREPGQADGAQPGADTAVCGRKRPQDGWRPGLYQASYRVMRDGIVVLEQDFSVGLGKQP
ncbi:M23 family metallopeptidase [Chelatococcus daeguensis]|uniref:M23 family metallopeptidase n=1 Tax=Chelatococcus daeguensis TaxID=444444 RepID=UPI001FD9C089|nr:M23 family metallopeptidase [Chelatococcus daeguensis]